MGISFQIRDPSCSPPWAPTSFLRHYLSKRQPDGAGDEFLTHFTCQPEADRGSNTLNEVLRQESGPLIALFGLDSLVAADLRRALASVRSLADTAVVDVTEDDATDAPQSEAALLDRLVRPAEAGLEREHVKRYLEYTRPCLFVLDLTDGGIQLTARKAACEAANALAKSFLTMKTRPRHRVLVLLERRYWLDAQTTTAKPYLPDARAWYRTEVKWPDTAMGRAYLLQDRAQSTAREEQEGFGLTPVDRPQARQWVVDAVAAGDTQQERCVQLLTGEPGAGKSTFLLKLPDHLPEGTAFVGVGFSRPRGWTSIEGLVKQLCQRICDTLGWDWDVEEAFRHANELQTPLCDVVMAARGFLRDGQHPFYKFRSSSNPPERRQPLQRLLIAVDALDEVEAKGHTDTKWLVDRLWELAGDGVYCLLKSRPSVVEHASHLVPPRQRLDLMQSAGEELAAFVDKNLPDVARRADRDQIIALADSNFLVAVLMVKRLKQLTDPDQVRGTLETWTAERGEDSLRLRR